MMTIVAFSGEEPQRHFSGVPSGKRRQPYQHSQARPARGVGRRARHSSSLAMTTSPPSRSACHEPRLCGVSQVPERRSGEGADPTKLTVDAASLYVFVRITVGLVIRPLTVACQILPPCVSLQVPEIASPSCSRSIVKRISRPAHSKVPRHCPQR